MYVWVCSNASTLLLCKLNQDTYQHSAGSALSDLEFCFIFQNSTRSISLFWFPIFLYIRVVFHFNEQQPNSFKRTCQDASLALVPILATIWGGVRLKSSLSAEEAQNQKLCSGAEIDVNFINSYILSAYYMKSYKKCGQKAQYLEIT